MKVDKLPKYMVSMVTFHMAEVLVQGSLFMSHLQTNVKRNTAMRMFGNIVAQSLTT